MFRTVTAYTRVHRGMSLVVHILDLRQEANGTVDSAVEKICESAEALAMVMARSQLVIADHEGQCVVERVGEEDNA